MNFDNINFLNYITTLRVLPIHRQLLDRKFIDFLLTPTPTPVSISHLQTTHENIPLNEKSPEEEDNDDTGARCPRHFCSIWFFYM